MTGMNIVRLIREECNIIGVISAYVHLHPAGKSYRALCPFHKEKTPSFYVSPEKGLWHCFGCGMGGDVIDFVQRMEGLTFIEAVGKLAKQLGLQWHPSATLRREEWVRLRLSRLNEWAQEFFERVLWSSRVGEKGRYYLSHRGIAPETARRFRLGYAPPSWNALTQALKEKGGNLDEAFQAGLVQKVRERDGYFDRFRDRLMFPIWNPQGEVIGFGGRTLGESQVKYLNTPETPLFQKRKCLYALPLALTAIRERGEVIVVEGYMDAITLHQAGFTNTVATMGTALNPDTVALLRRYTQRLILAYDADSAGLNAILRASDLFRESEMEVWVAMLPKDTDPDSFVLEQGREAFRECLENARSLVDFRVQRLLTLYPDPSPEGLRAGVALLTQFHDIIEQRDCLKKLAEAWGQGDPERMRELQDTLAHALRQWGRRKSPKVSPQTDPVTVHLTHPVVIPPGVQRAERELMAALVQDPEAARYILSFLSPDEFLQERHRELARLVAACLEDNTFNDLPLLVADLGDEELRQTLSGLMLYDLSFLHAQKAIEARIDRLRRYRIAQEAKRRREEILRRLQSGQLTSDDPTFQFWMEALRALKSVNG